MTESSRLRGRNPYDTGEVAEPFIWDPYGEPDRFGKVDFEDEAGDHICTIRVTPKGEGTFTLEIDQAIDTTINIEWI